MMTKKYEHTYNIYKYCAKRVLDYYRDKADMLATMKFYKNYKDIIKSPDKLRLNDILNCFAYESGYSNWGHLKNEINERIIKFSNLYKVYKAHIEAERKKRRFQFKNLFDTYQEYRDYTGFKLESENFSNLYIGVNQHTNYDQSLLHSHMSWLKINSCKFKKCVFIHTGFAGCDIRNSDFSNSIFSGIPKSVHGSAGLGSYVMYKSDYGKFDAEQGSFDTCDFYRAFLTDSYCRYATFDNCNFRKALLTCSNLQDSKILNSNLTGADFRYVQCGILKNCDMSSANLYGAHISLTQDIRVNCETTFPTGVKIDIAESNEQALAQGITTNSTENLYFICPNGHRWKTIMVRFALEPICSRCTTQSMSKRKISQYSEMVDPLRDQPDLLDFISPIYAMRKEAAMHGFPPQL